MNAKMPTSKEIEELVSFLPQLYADEFEPIKNNDELIKEKDGHIKITQPKYHKIVHEFFQMASKKCWSDPNYLSKEPRQMLENDEFIKYANLEQIKSMLSFCVRGERFSIGFWEGMIKERYVLKLLQRLAELRTK